MKSAFTSSIGRLSALIFFMAGAGGCSIAVPVHDLQPPHSLGKNVLQAGFMTVSNPVVGPDLKNYGFENRAADTETDASIMGLFFRYGITEKLDVEYESIANLLSGSTSLVSVKYQWLGQSLFAAKKGEWVGSVRAKYITADGYEDTDGSDTDEDDLYELDDLYFEKLEGSGYGLHQAFGYHVADWFLLNVGVGYHTFEVESRFRDGGPTGPVYNDSRDIDILSALYGFCFLPRWERFALSVCVEGGTHKTEKAFDAGEDNTVSTYGTSMAFNFKF